MGVLMMANKKIEFNLKTYEDIFSTQEMRDEAKLEKVQVILMEQLYPFKDHPFKMRDGEENEQLLESIRHQGTIEPLLARPLDDGKYEIISGHRRYNACKEIGIVQVPVIVRDLTDEQAVSMMVDSNIHHENILPSEKAYAYKMKLEAVKKQGNRTDLTSSQLGAVDKAHLPPKI